MSPAIQEEIRFVTFAFDGEKLKEWQIVQRLVKAGFKDLDTLVTMFAIVLGESGGFKKAWHANVKRSDDRMSIIKNSEGQMLVQSVDLGLIQKNLEIFGDGTWVDMKQDSMSELVETLFAENPELADAQESVNLAFKLWQQRGFKPWYAYKPGTESFFVKERLAAKAIGNYVLRTKVGRKANSPGDYGMIPVLEFVDPRA